MTATIPESHRDLLEGPVVVSFVSILPDGMPHASAVWCLWDGTHVIVNSAAGRQKNKNVARNPKVAVLAIDPQNPYRYLEVRGIVTEITKEGALEDINAMAKLYRGVDSFFGGVVPAENIATEIRVTFKITPQKVIAHG